MTDWEKLKVTDLKEELKSRGIPLTGLKLKQQLIDKLNELDADTHTERDAAEKYQEDVAVSNAESSRVKDDVEDEEHSAQPSVRDSRDPRDQSPTPSQDQPVSIERASSQTPPNDVDAKANEQPRAERQGRDEIPSLPADEVTGDERVERLPDTFPAELKKEESQAKDGSTPPPAAAETALEDQIMKEDDPFIAQNTGQEEKPDSVAADAPGTSQTVQPMDLEVSTALTTGPQSRVNQDSQTGSTASSSSPPRESSLGGAEDQHKRKRRSATPVPDSHDVARKRLKLDEGSPAATERESTLLKKVQDATDAAQAIRHPTHLPQNTEMQVPHDTDDEDMVEKDKNKSGFARRSGSITPGSQREQRQISRSPSRSSLEDDVIPATHPATHSLYIRNFKRPLHIPTLRSHIASLAGISPSDPIKTFYLDSIRTHAFVSLTSVSAAVRVRNAMHGTRFPDEPMREPLWIDFIPDERVEAWIEQETGSGGGGFGGGRGSSKKYEVIYDNHGNGIEATLQEQSDSHAQGQRPPLSQSRSNRMVPQDPTAAAAVTSGIHPSRALLVPQSPSKSYSQPAAKPSTRPSDPGKGFRALDELFSSTTAKPKLYYKLPAQAIVDDRLDMIRGLRVNHDEMGQSGDEGMKRYTFERNDRSGRDEWVDKGPEFGFGRRGQERLTGFGNAYGNSRARGGFRGARRGGDSWRGR